MIAILEDKNGFKKEMVFAERYPVYTMTKQVGNEVKFGRDFFGSEYVTSVTPKMETRKFYPELQPSIVHGVAVQLYLER